MAVSIYDDVGGDYFGAFSRASSARGDKHSFVVSTCRCVHFLGNWCLFFIFRRPLDDITRLYFNFLNNLSGNTGNNINKDK